MSIDPKDAAASLNEVASVEERTRQAITYEHSSRQFLLWGVLVVCGYLNTFFNEDNAAAGWIAVVVIGVLGSVALRVWTPVLHSRDRRLGRRIGYAQLVLIGFGLILLWLLWPVNHRQLNAFWPTLVMFCHVLAGLWLGAFFIVVGVSVTALIVIGYAWAGAWYPLWLAATVGGGLIVSGLWLRRLS
ncbi:MAG TPA: hypothetical protein VE397_06045 [Stellaceae bacterium]|jgi:uncharacterized membrane-anchored protein|nr:hypothetical protein [Stellaceae bacterium]